MHKYVFIAKGEITKCASTTGILKTYVSPFSSLRAQGKLTYNLTISKGQVSEGEDSKMLIIFHVRLSSIVPP